MCQLGMRGMPVLDAQPVNVTTEQRDGSNKLNYQSTWN